MTEKSLAEQILDAYDVRSCFICQLPGLCRHREGRVEAAIIEAQQRKPGVLKVMKPKKDAVGGGQ